MKDLGLVLTDNNKLHYGFRRGFGLGWLPDQTQRWIVALWNEIACRIFGHNDVLWHLRDVLPRDESVECVDCLAPLTGCSCRRRDEHSPS